MSKSYSATKHLYTLNDEKDSSYQEPSDTSSIQDHADIDFQQLQRQYKKISKKNEEYHRKMGELQLKNQQLVELNQLSEKRNLKHEEKQRDLIKRLSYFQVANQQLSMENKKVQQDIIQVQENKKVSENHASQLKQLIRKAHSDRDRFLIFLKNILEMLKRCDRPEEYQKEKEKIMNLLAKNLNNAESTQKITFDFDFKFQLSRVDTLKQKIRALERQLQQSHQNVEKQKAERRKTASAYNQKIARLRQLHDDLKTRVQNQEEQHRRKIKAIVQEKNETIQNLKSRLQQSRARKSSMQVRRSRENKSFIGDGQYSHLQLNQLNQAIQTLQMQIIKQFEE